MKYSGHRKLLCEFSKLSKLNAFLLLEYQTNTDESILVYKFHPERTGFNMYAEYTQPQLTFLCIRTLDYRIQSPFSLIKTYLNVYIYIHYYKFYRAEFDSKYRSIQKPLPFNKKQTKLYLFYHLESLVEVEWAFLSSPPPFILCLSAY